MRDLIAKVAAIGWKPEGYDGNGHIVMAHEDGHRTSIPATPSEWRSTTNALAMLERIGGQKLPRPNHRKSRKSMRTETPAEVEASRRRHAQTWDEKCAERDRERAAEQARRAEIEAIKAAERRRREIEDLMR